MSMLFLKLPQQFENHSKEILSDKCQDRNGSHQELENQNVARSQWKDVVQLLYHKSYHNAHWHIIQQMCMQRKEKPTESIFSGYDAMSEGPLRFPADFLLLSLETQTPQGTQVINCKHGHRKSWCWVVGKVMMILPLDYIGKGVINVRRGREGERDRERGTDSLR